MQARTRRAVTSIVPVAGVSAPLVAVTVRIPVVRSTVALKNFTPASAVVNVYAGGTVPFGSLVENDTVPPNPVATFPNASNAVMVNGTDALPAGGDTWRASDSTNAPEPAICTRDSAISSSCSVYH